MDLSLYDYISLRANSSHSVHVKIDYLMSILTDELGCEQASNASCYYQIGSCYIRIQGIECDKNGNYAFDSDESLKKVNLIEINLPQGSESQHGTEIIAFTNSLSDKIGWEIDWET